MAAARKLSSYTEINLSNNSRTIPTQAQSPRVVPPSKSPRGLGKQQSIPLEYDPVGAFREQLDQLLKDRLSGYHWPWPSEENSDQEGHKYGNKLQDRKGTSGLDLPQNNSTRFFPRPRRDLTAPKSPYFDHDSSPRMRCDRQSHPRGRHELRSGWSPDGPEYALATTTPATRLLEMDSDIESEMLFLPETRPISFGLNVGQRAIYQLTNNQHSGKEHREKWSKDVWFRHNEVASKGVFAERLDNQNNTLFFMKKISSQGPCGSTSSAEIRGSILLSHSVSEQTIAPNELDLLGSDRIRRWKDGPGRNKDWKSSCYLKSMRKRGQAKFQVSYLGRRSNLDTSKATNYYLAITHSPSHIAVPKDMLRQNSTSCQGHSSCLKPKSSWQAMDDVNDVGLTKKTILVPKSLARCEPWMTDPIDSWDIEEARRPQDRFSADPEVSNARIHDLLNEMASTHTETPSPKFETPDTKSISLNHLLAPESFVDTILGACLRLKRLVRTESHYEVYNAESFLDGNQKYEVRVYNLRGVSAKERNYKIRNLKRASTRNSCVGSLDQGGKRWLVFAEARVELALEPVIDCGPLWRTEEDYDRAFPVLEPHKPHESENTEKKDPRDEIVVEAYNARVETALKKELLKNPGAYQVIDELRELLVTSFNSCHHCEKSTPLSEERKKIRSPEQEMRLRDRQRLSRQTKRRAKAALKSAKTPERGSFGMENNDAATIHTVDIVRFRDLLS